MVFGGLFQQLLPGSMDAFGLGMFSAYLAYHLRFKMLEMHYTANLAMLAMLLLFGICMVLLNQFWMYYWSGGLMSYIFSALFSTTIAIGAFAAQIGSSWAKWLLGNFLMRFLGTISYSFYLWHIPVINFLKIFPRLQEIGPHKNLILLILCTIILTIISWLSWRFIELPAVNWGKSITRKKTDVPLNYEFGTR
jgi:peptidoglycan/LPS O-acetylase OafA/YrhL